MLKLGHVAAAVLSIATVSLGQEATPPGGGAATVNVAALKGRNVGLPWRGKQLPIYTPTNYDPAQPAPVFLYYPGTSGIPSTGLIARATGGKDFVVVGMAYLRDGMFKGSQTQALNELLNGAQVVRRLKQMGWNVDAGRLYVGGTSKGGWVSSLIAEAKMNELAGVMVLAAGKVPSSRARASRKRIKPAKPLYIGVGELDPNMVASRSAIRHFSGLGARITYDEYLGKGHDVEVTEAMKDWFRIESRRETEGFVAHVDGHLTSLVEQASRDLAGIDRYLELLAIQRGPWYAAASPESRKAVDKVLAQARRDRSLSKELKAASAYNTLVAKEIAARRNPTPADRVGLSTKLDRSMAGLNKTISEYRRIHRLYPDTYFGRKSLREVERVQAHIRYVNSR